MSSSRTSSSSLTSRPPKDHCCSIVFTAVLGVFAFSGVVNWFYFQGRMENCISVGEMMTGLPQNDTRIIKYISTYHLVPPSTLSYNFINKSILVGGRNATPEGSLTYSVQKVLGFKTKGFFLECSAFDGETSSKTLALERQYKWTGLLIEPDPFVFPKLVFKHRKAWTSDVCLSPDPVPQRLEFLHRIDHDSLQKTEASFHRPKNGTHNEIKFMRGRWRKVQVPCFPIFSVLSAINVFRIHYLSLDVQGLELQVLKTIPWNLLRIDVISVSHQLVPEGPEALKKYLESVGYWLVSDFPREYLFANQSAFPVEKLDYN